MPEFKKLIARLKSHYGEPAVPPAKGPFELVMWENACYLLPDERRAAVFEGLRKQVGPESESNPECRSRYPAGTGNDGRHASQGAGVSLAGDRTNHPKPV